MFPSHSGGGQEIISLRLQATEHPLLSLVERIRNQESEKIRSVLGSLPLA